MTIQYGSIEVITEDGRNYGFPINDLNPLGDGAVRNNQIKARTGVQVGTVIDVDEEEAKRLGPTHVASLSGNLGDGAPVTVRIYQTAEGGA